MKCKQCGSSIKSGKFCNKSCSAKFNNQNRTRKDARKTKSCKECKSNFIAKRPEQEFCSRVCGGKQSTPKSTKAPFTRIYRCQACSKYFDYQICKYCKTCAPNIRHYRSRCSFKFNVYEYPEQFDLNLLETHGWYSPGAKPRKET